MKLQIEITSTTATTRRGIKEGKAWQMIEQGGMVTYPNGERRRTALLLDDGAPDLLPGLYEPTDNAVFPGNFGAIRISMDAKNWQRVDAAKSAGK